MLWMLPAAGAVLAALYLWMIMPRVIKKPDMGLFREEFYAHRGLYDNASDAPENSMAAFARAVEAGYGIELDIRLSKDGIPVVFHDDTLERICGAEGRVSERTFCELQQLSLCGSQEKIPKLEEVLQLVDGRVPLIIEFKIEKFDCALCFAADRLLRDYGGAYCMESFHPLGLWWYRKNRPEVCRGQLSDAFLRGEEYRGVLYFFLQNLLFNFVGRPDFIAYNCKYPQTLSKRLCRGLYRSRAAAWTVQSRDMLEQARKHFDLFIFEGFLPRENRDKI